MAVLLSGCTVGPDYQRPPIALPSAYHQPIASVTNQRPASLTPWWRLFHDPQLEALISEATTANYDVRLAQARLREARAQAGVVRSAWFPALNANGEYARERLSQNTPEGFLARSVGQSLEQNFFNAGFDMNWELDIFGGNRRAVQAAKADVGAAEESSRGALITVLGDVGLNYLDLRGLQKQLAVARDNLRLQEQTLALTQDQFKAGLASELDTSRAEAQAANTRSQIPLFEQDIQRSIHRLSLLIGKEPAELESRLAPSGPIPSAAPDIPVGLPSDLLRRRPDIRQAERDVAAASARVGVATADLFPTLSLGGSIGASHGAIADLLKSGVTVWSAQAQLAGSVFSGFSQWYTRRAAIDAYDQSLADYQQTVLAGLAQVADAMTALKHDAGALRAQSAALAAAEEGLKLVRANYQAGTAGYLDLLNADSEYQQARLAYIGALTQRLQDTVALYAALGGGWWAEQPPSGLRPEGK